MQSSRRTAKRKPLTAKFHGDENGKLAITCREEADRIMDEIRGERFEVLEVKKGERVKKARRCRLRPVPAAGGIKTLNFPISKTMRIAQQLYEGVDVKGQGTVGLITTCVRIPSVFRMRRMRMRERISHRITGKNS